MRLRIGDRSWRGRALDLRGTGLAPRRLVAAIRRPERSVVVAPPPGPLHDFVGFLHPSVSLSLRSALAAAARSRGDASPHDPDIAALDRAIADVAPTPVDRESVRRRAANAGADVAALRERVATLRGRIEADQDAGRPTAERRERHRAAIARLSEAETEATAARQALAMAEREARANRDRRERRLSLADERDNLERRARRHLAARWRPRFERALSALSVGDTPDEFRAAMAVARVGDLGAPVVLVDGPFEDPVRARAALDAQVILV